MQSRWNHIFFFWFFISGVESQRYFYLYTSAFNRFIFSTDGRTGGRVKSWRLRDWFQRASQPVIFFLFPPNNFFYFVLEIVFFISSCFSSSGRRELTNSLFDRTCVCVCGCTKTGKPVFLCVFSLFLYIFLQLWKSRGIIEKSQVIIVCIAQHPVDTYARRLQTSPNAYVIYLYSPNKQTNKACQYRYPVAPGFCLVSNNQKLVSTGILRVTKKWKIFWFFNNLSATSSFSVNGASVILFLLLPFRCIYARAPIIIIIVITGLIAWLTCLSQTKIV